MITEYSIAKQKVENTFLNSDYIKSRNISGEKKYFPEEVHYWATKIINTNMSESLFLSEFNSTYSSIQKPQLGSLKFNDYIGQTFFVDSTVHPDGLFLTSIGLFFSSADTSAPISLEIRPLVNGYPSSTESIPLSQVTLDPRQVISTTFPLVSANATKFTFKFPVFLAPGFYSFVLSTNSSKYSLFFAERGAADSYTGKTIVNPYNGSFVVSQQGLSWTVEQTKDLCFTLNKANFEIGTKSFSINSGSYNYNYTTAQLQSKSLEFGTKAYVDNCSITNTDYNTLLQNTIPIKLNKNIDLLSYSTALENDGALFDITLTNTSKHISPLIDLEKTGIVLIENLIDPYSIELSNSELTKDGTAQCKYITKQITLNDNFDADGLTVYIDTNKPTGTSIEVFYKIQNKYDFTQEFKDLNWVKMTKVSESTPATNSEDYVEESYQDVNLWYLDGKEQYHDNFKYFAIKIVMYSNNPCIVPTVKNFRAIATV